MKKSLLMLAATVGVMLATTANANEWDRVNAAPQGLVVRIDAQGNREVFRADAPKATTEEAAQEIAKTAVDEANKISDIKVYKRESEYDAPGITKEAWYYYWGWGWGSYYYPYYWGYYGYYNSWYYPSYYWNWGGYRYGYYCW